MDTATYPVSAAMLPHLLPDQWSQPTAIAVVIDTLRFTSTAAVALNHGAQAITIVSDIEQARQIASQLPESSLLCGERHCVRIAGFQVGNSPLEYQPELVADRQLVFSTTNGTFAVDAARSAHTLLLGSLLNRAAIAAEIARLMQTVSGRPSRVWLVCAGTDGQVALEDVLTAGAILSGLAAIDPHARLDGDAAHLALNAWHQVEAQGPAALLASLQLALGGRNLIQAGFAHDLAAVAQLDSLDVVPISTPSSQYASFRAARRTHKT